MEEASQIDVEGRLPYLLGAVAMSSGIDDAT